jgi:hypothetical protein
MLVEIHMLQNLCPSNPNRDELGAPKTAVFGGKLRARISSQCLKRAIRGGRNPKAPDDPVGIFQEAMHGRVGIRTKLFPKLVEEELKSSSIPPGEHAQVVAACCSIARAESKTGGGQGGGEAATAEPRTAQLIFLGPHEAAEFVRRLAAAANSMKPEYKMFLDPVATFQDVVRERLEADGRFGEREHKRILGACWPLAKGLRDQRRADADGADPGGAEGANGPLPGDEPLGPADADAFLGWLSEMDPKDRSAALNRPKDKKEWPKPITDGQRKKLKMREFYACLRGAGPDGVPPPNGVDIALFGRMTTSDAFENVEAAMQVAHAISTNELTPEVDYFTAVDDLGEGPEASHIGETQHNSSTFYKYFSLDWDALLRNLGGGHRAKQGAALTEEQLENNAKALALAGRTLRAFLEASACSLPSGKRNSFGNSCLPDGVLVEVKGRKIPTNYANAFLAPAEPRRDADGFHDWMEDSIRKLAHYVDSVATGYCLPAARWWYTTRPEIPFTGPGRADGSGGGRRLAEPCATFPELLDKVLGALGVPSGEEHQ